MNLERTKEKSGQADKENMVPTPKGKSVNRKSRLSLMRLTQSQCTALSKQRKRKSQNIAMSHPACKFIFSGSPPSSTELKKFASILYQGLLYSICSLKGPSEEYIRKKSIRLPEGRNNGLKFLMLDLDETLVHSIWDGGRADVELKAGDEAVRFNVRPYCLPFLAKVSQYFQVFIFTASTADYAAPIVQFLNLKKKTIQGVLSRSHCLETNNGFRIKDLRVIKNRPLQEIVIVDNLVHCFGLQLDNGIPILEFTDNRDDRELLGLERTLLQLREATDVREWISSNLGLRKCLQIPEDEFTAVNGLPFTKITK